MKQVMIMQKKTLFIGLLCCLACMLKAENYPYRSDLLWVTVPDRADRIYRTGEMATVEVQLYRHGIPLHNLEVNYETGGERLPADTQGTVLLLNGKARVPVGTLHEPGFRDCRLSVTVDGRTYAHHVKVGFSPEKLRPYTQLPPDFRTFWDRAMKEQQSFPLSYTREPLPEYSTDKMDCYLVRLPLNGQGQCVYGHLFYPKGRKEKCPVVFCPPGAGIKTIREPLRHSYYTDEGFIRLEIEIHGLNPRMSDEQFKEISNAFNGKENGYLFNGLEHPDTYYMKRVYLACIRSIDLLTSLPEWDGKNVVVQGGSQGGALALVTAGLDRRVTACIANYPALADMAGYKAGRAGGYPHINRHPHADTPAKLHTLAYYDVVNFARYITAPTCMMWGFNDDVCPPTTSYIVYNLLTCPKEAFIMPINEHWISDESAYRQMLWAKRQLR